MLRDCIQSVFRLLFPACCPVCKQPLTLAEEGVCLSCLIKLPCTRLHEQTDNEMERMLRGHFPLERATAYFHYDKGSNYTALLHQLKYEGKKKLGKTLGQYAAIELMNCGFFNGIDCIVPVPLHPSKHRKRGYNQSEWIALGIAQVTGLPVYAKAVSRILANETQTHQSTFGRRDSMHGLFRLSTPNDLRGKHILLIDDVLTTGATLMACMEAFAETDQVKFSIFTLSKARHS